MGLLTISQFYQHFHAGELDGYKQVAGTDFRQGKCQLSRKMLKSPYFSEDHCHSGVVTTYYYLKGEVGDSGINNRLLSKRAVEKVEYAVIILPQRSNYSWQT